MRESGWFISRSASLISLAVVVLCFALANESFARVTMTVLYDNNPYRDGMVAKHGFSCMIKGTERSILFDTGGDGAVLLHNIRMLGVDAADVGTVVISHDHGDHTGGLLPFLSLNSDVSVYLPQGLSAGLAQQVSAAGARITSVNLPTPICKGVYSTGVMGEAIPEQTLVLNSKQGLILICGCAHPGIINIIQSAMRIFKKPVLFVFGGFHLEGASEERIKEIIKQFNTNGVKKVGGTHCTGARAMQMFQQTYRENYIQMGVGKIVGLQ